MLGSHDFCGYYDWTFAHVRKQFGQAAVQSLWTDAIAGESQAHYLDAARNDGLKGLLRTWTQTGEDEHCDWTFTLDADRNVLRWDMRQCPSKGYLLDHDLNADEDYCDHCMGWIIPLLERAGIEVAVHEHNHCGQCFAELRVKGRAYRALNDRDCDIRRDPRWSAGYIDRWRDNRKQPAIAGLAHLDAADALADWLRTRRPTFLSSGEYMAGELSQGAAYCVVVDDDLSPSDALELARRAQSSRGRTLLVRAYWPQHLRQTASRAPDALPRPFPLLPLLIRRGLYQHVPGGEPPGTHELIALLKQAQTPEVRAP
jgi:hypothetical protein